MNNKMLLQCKKGYILSIAFILLSVSSLFGQEAPPIIPNPNPGNQPVRVMIAREATFPGGPAGFANFIKLKLQYPELAQLLGVNGKVRVSFTVSTDGSLTNIKAIDTIGYECEQAAVNVIAASPRWKPALQANTPVEVHYTLPIAFSVPKEFVDLDELNGSHYAFLFERGGKIYKNDEAQKSFGSAVPKNTIESVTLYTDNKYSFPKKKAVYLIKLKD